MKKRFLAFLSFILGIGAILGAFLALIPGATERMGITNDMLKFSPFTNFVIPGVFLFVVLGIGNLLSATLLIRKNMQMLYAHLLLGIILVFWIVIQSVMMQMVVMQHMIFFFVGLFQFYLSYLIIKKEEVALPFQAKQH